jgi:hypothetical protein
VSVRSPEDCRAPKVCGGKRDPSRVLASQLITSSSSKFDTPETRRFFWNTLPPRAHLVDCFFHFDFNAERIITSSAALPDYCRFDIAASSGYSACQRAPIAAAYWLPAPYRTGGSLRYKEKKVSALQNEKRNSMTSYDLRLTALSSFEIFLC